jgi:DNA-binding SARP family transcriptional activator
VDFRLLGPLEVLDGRDEIVVGGDRRRALLVLLLLHRNEVVPAERLIEELWDGEPPPTASKALQVHVSRLRKDLGAANGTALTTRSGGYVLEVDPGGIDIVRFERAVADAEQARADGRVQDASERLREGLALWRGPPLLEFTYAGFAQEEIARLAELRLTALEERIDADLALGRHHAVVAELEGLVRAHPLRERLRGQLMLALHRCGRQADALEVFAQGRRHGVHELGLEPGADVRELQRRILADDPTLAPPPTRSRLPAVPRRASLAILAAGALLVVAAVAIVLLTRDPGSAARPPVPALDIAPNSAVGLDAAGGQAAFSVPLSGRATDLAADGDRLFAVSIDSSALTIVNGRTRRQERSFPLPMGMRPAAVAVRDGAVWVADGGRGLAVRMDSGYERIAETATWNRATRREALGVSARDSTAIALAGGAAWITDGSDRLVRMDDNGAVTRERVGHQLNGIASGAGAVWAISTADATVLRIDPATGRVTDEIAIVRRPGSEAPAPIALAVTAEAVWVLNANTASVTKIDVRTLGIRETLPLAIETSPRDIDAGAGAVWVAAFDGTVTRIATTGGEPRSSFVGTSLVAVAGARDRVWAAAVALDQQLPGAD